MNLALERLWTDDDGMLAVDVRVSNGRQTSTMKTFFYPSEFEEFGAELQEFPRNVAHVAVLESGSRAPRWFGHFRMRVSFRPPSRAIIDIRAFVPDDQPDPFDARFCAEMEPAALNELGRQLRGWVTSDSGRFVYPPIAGD